VDTQDIRAKEMERATTNMKSRQNCKKCGVVVVIICVILVVTLSFIFRSNPNTSPSVIVGGVGRG
jgi:hypothetical protein